MERIGSVQEMYRIAVDGAAGEDEREARGRAFVRRRDAVGFGEKVEKERRGIGGRVGVRQPDVGHLGAVV